MQYLEVSGAVIYIYIYIYVIRRLKVKKSGGLNLLKPCGPVQACNGTPLPFTFTITFNKIVILLSHLRVTRALHCFQN